MTLIGLGLSGFTRRLSIPEVELPYSSTRRRQNASISSSSSSSHQQYPQAQHGIQSSTTSTSSFWTRPSLTPLLGHDSGEEEEGEARDWQHKEKYYSNESDYDGYLDTGKQYHRRRSSWSASSLSPSRSLANLSKQGLITLVYLVLFGIVLLTYFLQNGIQPRRKAYDTLAKLRYKIGVRHTQHPLQSSQRIQKEEKRIVWYSDMKENTTMPKPFDGYRWTFLHANVMPVRGFNETQERLEMLTFIECKPYFVDD